MKYPSCIATSLILANRKLNGDILRQLEDKTEHTYAELLSIHILQNEREWKEENLYDSLCRSCEKFMICPCCGKEMERNAELEKLVARYEGGDSMDIYKFIELLIKERKSKQ